MDEQHLRTAGGRMGAIVTVRQAVRLAIGLGIPFCAIDLAIPFTTRVNRIVLGMPFAVFWMVLSFIVAFLCMLVTWLVFDRAGPEAGR